jgi:hypothetical protein
LSPELDHPQPLGEGKGEGLFLMIEITALAQFDSDTRISGVVFAFVRDKGAKMVLHRLGERHAGIAPQA